MKLVYFLFISSTFLSPHACFSHDEDKPAKDTIQLVNEDTTITELQNTQSGIVQIVDDSNENSAIAHWIVDIVLVLIIIVLSGLLVYYYRSKKHIAAVNKLVEYQRKEIVAKNQQLTWLNEEINKQIQNVKERNKELEELNGLKDRLFSIIAHEFKSPLNSLKGTLSLIHSGILSGQEIDRISKELSKKINTTSIFLDNLLSWSKSQMNGITAKPTIIDIQKIVKEDINLLKPIAEGKGIQVKNNISEPLSAYADENMMYLVIRNLISNAIKFSLMKGVIEVFGEVDGENVLVKVKDSGIGMSRENLSSLFKLQPPITPGTANEKGTGLGLYISKSFLESNGGKIWAESKPEKGSTFFFTIPRDAGA